LRAWLFALSPSTTRLDWVPKSFWGIEYGFSIEQRDYRRQTAKKSSTNKARKRAPNFTATIQQLQLGTRDTSPKDLDVHHAYDNELVTCEIMAALYGWRVRPPHSSLTMSVPSHSPPFSFVRSLGGMCGAIVTSPFDVVKTRLQSDLFRQKHAGVGALVGDSVVLVRRPGGFLWHFVETAHIIRCVPHSFLFSPLRAILSHTQHIIFGEIFLTI